MSIEAQELRPSLWVLSPAGRLDHLLTPELEATLIGIQQQGGKILVVDMSAVSYINSGGLRALVTSWRRARAMGGDLRLAAMTSQVRDVFEMVGFQQVFATYATVDAACDAGDTSS